MEFNPFGANWMAVRCPSELDPLMRQAGSLWEPRFAAWAQALERGETADTDEATTARYRTAIAKRLRK